MPEFLVKIWPWPKSFLPVFFFPFFLSKAQHQQTTFFREQVNEKQVKYNFYITDLVGLGAYKVSALPWLVGVACLAFFLPIGSYLNCFLRFSFAMRKALFPVLLLAALFVAVLLSGCLTGIADTNSSRDEKCFLEPDPGPCEAAIPRYFLGETGDCEQFLWGGCQGVAPFESLEECRQACGIRVVAIMAVFEDKVVYSTDAAVDTIPLREDCAERGGSFNECGSACASDAETCVAVCAFACELGS
jgi:hypothetical protein